MANGRCRVHVSATWQRGVDCAGECHLHIEMLFTFDLVLIDEDFKVGGQS
jgi:hypothetical protein